MSAGNVVGCTGTGLRQFSGILSVTDISGNNIAALTSNTIVFGNNTDIPTYQFIGNDFSFQGINGSGTAILHINAPAGTQARIDMRSNGNGAGSPFSLYQDFLGNCVFINGANGRYIFKGAVNNNVLDIDCPNGGIGFFGASAQGPAARTISGSKGGNVALGNLLTVLFSMGLIGDATTP